MSALCGPRYLKGISVPCDGYPSKGIPCWCSTRQIPASEALAIAKCNDSLPPRRVEIDGVIIEGPPS